MPVQIPQVDYGMLGQSFSILGKAKTTSLYPEEYKIRDELRDLKRSSERRQTIMGIADAGINLASSIYKIAVEANSLKALRDVNAINDRYRTEMETAVHNNTLKRTSKEVVDENGEKRMIVEVELPPEMVNQHKADLDEMKRKYGFTTEVRKWAEESIMAAYDSAKAYGIKSTYAKEENERQQNFEAATKEAVTRGDYDRARKLVEDAGWLTPEGRAVAGRNVEKMITLNGLERDGMKILAEKGAEAAVAYFNEQRGEKGLTDGDVDGLMSRVQQRGELIDQAAKNQAVEAFYARVKAGEVPREASDKIVAALPEHQRKMVRETIQKNQALEAHNNTFRQISELGVPPAELLRRLQNPKSKESMMYDSSDKTSETWDQKHDDMKALESLVAAEGSGSEQRAKAFYEVVKQKYINGEKDYSYETSLAILAGLGAEWWAKFQSEMREYLPTDVTKTISGIVNEVKAGKDKDYADWLSLNLGRFALDYWKAGGDTRRLEVLENQLRGFAAEALEMKRKGLTGEIGDKTSMVATVGGMLAKRAGNRGLVDVVGGWESGSYDTMMTDDQGRIVFTSAFARDQYTAVTGALLESVAGVAGSTANSVLMENRRSTGMPRWQILTEPNPDREGDVRSNPIFLDRQTGKQYKFVPSGKGLQVLVRDNPKAEFAAMQVLDEKKVDASLAAIMDRVNRKEELPRALTDWIGGAR